MVVNAKVSRIRFPSTFSSINIQDMYYSSKTMSKKRMMSLTWLELCPWEVLLDLMEHF